MSALARLNSVGAHLGTRAVLQNVSLDIHAGEITAIIGPNGAGKSSLLKVLAGLLKPTSGTLTFNGAPHASIAASERALEIAYLPQHRAIHWPMPVRAIVGLGRLPHQATGRSTEDGDASAIDAAMAAMDVAAFAERPVLALSGGEQARVLMARALAQEPKLLLADEPTSGLDLSHQFALGAVLRARALGGTACLVALHDLPLAARIADRIVIMAGGQIVADGAPADVLTPARILSVYGVHMQVLTVGDSMVFVPQAF
jgi:iron complex transport system ATP-binding protein